MIRSLFRESVRLPRRAGAMALVCAAFAAPAVLHAHADHGKPVHGGVVAEAGVFQGELVAGPKGPVLYITDHGTPVPTAGASAKVIVLTGTTKSELEFVPAGENRLAPARAQTIAAGSRAVATVRLGDGRSGALRFEVR